MPDSVLPAEKLPARPGATSTVPEGIGSQRITTEGRKDRCHKHVPSLQRQVRKKLPPFAKTCDPTTRD
eukprot:758278-Amphidinium_carterae.1